MIEHVEIQENPDYHTRDEMSNVSRVKSCCPNTYECTIMKFDAHPKRYPRSISIYIHDNNYAM